MDPTSADIESLLTHARSQIDRVDPVDLAADVAAGALLVDIRPAFQRRADGTLTGAVVIDRNVAEWRLDPTSPWRIPEITSASMRVIVACNEGYASSLLAADLRRLGLAAATDLSGGYQALLRAGSDLLGGGTGVDRSVWSADWLGSSPTPR